MKNEILKRIAVLTYPNNNIPDSGFYVNTMDDTTELFQVDFNDREKVFIDLIAANPEVVDALSNIGGPDVEFANEFNKTLNDYLMSNKLNIDMDVMLALVVCKHIPEPKFTGGDKGILFRCSISRGAFNETWSLENICSLVIDVFSVVMKIRPEPFLDFQVMSGSFS